MISKGGEKVMVIQLVCGWYFTSGMAPIQHGSFIHVREISIFFSPSLWSIHFNSSSLLCTLVILGTHEKVWKPIIRGGGLERWNIWRRK
jgi:hypothetical protein